MASELPGNIAAYLKTITGEAHISALNRAVTTDVKCEINYVGDFPGRQTTGMIELADLIMLRRGRNQKIALKSPANVLKMDGSNVVVSFVVVATGRSGRDEGERLSINFDVSARYTLEGDRIKEIREEWVKHS